MLLTVIGLLSLPDLLADYFCWQTWQPNH